MCIIIVHTHTQTQKHIPCVQMVFEYYSEYSWVSNTRYVFFSIYYLFLLFQQDLFLPECGLYLIYTTCMIHQKKKKKIKKWLTCLHSFTLAFISLQLILTATAVRLHFTSYFHTPFFSPLCIFTQKKIKLTNNIEVIQY